MSTFGSPVPTTVMTRAGTVPAKANMAPATAMRLRFIVLLLLSLLQNQVLDVAAVGLLLRDVQHQFLELRGRSPKQSNPLAAGAHAQDLHGPAVHAPRGLDSRTCEI